MSLIKTICGWGVNDVDYPVQIKKDLPKVNGKRKREVVWVCPYYLDWKAMINRCFNPNFHKKSPSYKGCTVCEEWKYLSNFIKWVDSQPNGDWQNCHLDKDFLVEGNRHYSPETCVYITQKLNKFPTDGKASGSKLMTGVDFYSRMKTAPFGASCCNPFTNKREHLGYFTTELEAHKAWKAKKHEFACIYSELQPDIRVANKLRNMYSLDKDLIKYFIDNFVEEF